MDTLENDTKQNLPISTAISDGCHHNNETNVRRLKRSVLFELTVWDNNSTWEVGTH